MPDRTAAEWEALYYEAIDELMAALVDNLRLRAFLNSLQGGVVEDAEAPPRLPA